MSAVEHTINLARKWRCAHFDQLIGQELPVKMIKNSLYKGYWCPVYLFSGTHGCGKTTTARMFAAAINCVQLEKFQTDPRSGDVPCDLCVSCLLMKQGKHPDFIEIDGASNTGVDNVRGLIETASLLPVLGRKKIYLIDEAHMLSRAAFNAFLKVLEEPPISTIFMLATTDPDKIIDTVKSRCFELSFKPVGVDILVDHLIAICKEEQIGYEDAGLRVIAVASRGCVRDAINLLERVRFAHSTITASVVQDLLGQLDVELLLKMLTLVLQQNAHDLLMVFKKIKNNGFSVEHAWYTLVDLVKTIIMLKHGIADHRYRPIEHLLKQTASTSSMQMLLRILDHLYEMEERLLKTRAQRTFFEILLLQLIQGGSSNGPAGAAPLAMRMPDESVSGEALDDGEVGLVDTELKNNMVPTNEHDTVVMPYKKRWQHFLNRVRDNGDPLLYSVFSHVYDIRLTKNNMIEVDFSEEFRFLSTILVETKSVWLSMLQESFSLPVDITVLFVQKNSSHHVNKGFTRALVEDKSPVPANHGVMKNIDLSDSISREPLHEKKAPSIAIEMKKQSQSSSLDVSDTTQWPATNLVLSYFSGVVEEVDA